MLKTHEIRIGHVLRWWIGFLGLIAFSAGVVLMVREGLLIATGQWIRLLGLLFFSVIAVGGVSLIRSAITGYLPVRSYGRRKDTIAAQQSAASDASRR